METGAVRRIDSVDEAALSLDREWRRSHVLGLAASTCNGTTLLYVATATACTVLSPTQLRSQPLRAHLQDETFIKAIFDTTTIKSDLNCRLGFELKGCVSLSELVMTTRLAETRPLFHPKCLHHLAANVFESASARCACPHRLRHATDAILNRSTLLRMFESRLDEYENCTIYSWCSRPSPPSVKPPRIDGKKKFSFPTRHSALYDNCLLLAPDGARLAYISLSRANFYLRRSLADIEKSQVENIDCSMCIRLRFVPSCGSAVNTSELSLRDNVCVVCGSSESLVRSYIVARCYRRLFPPHLKDRDSHDILLQCSDCYKTFQEAWLGFRRRLAACYNAPLDGVREAPAVAVCPRLIQARKAARALLRHRQSLPQTRADQLLSLVSEFGSVESVSCLEVSGDRGQWHSHAQLVLKAVGTDTDSLQAFVHKCRSLFLTVMKPRFLPPQWSLHSPIGCQ